MKPDDPRAGSAGVDGDLPRDSDVTAVDTAAVRRDVVLAVSVGGALGALARWALAEALPHDPGAWPWATLAANVSGCFALGVLMVLVVERWPSRRLLRPFLGTGFLGGYTTFSTYAVDTRGLAAAGHPALAAAYLLSTLALGLLAVVAAFRLTERVRR